MNDKKFRIDKECPMHGGKENFSPINREHATAMALHDDAVQLYRLSRLPDAGAFQEWLEVLENKIDHYRQNTIDKRRERSTHVSLKISERSTN